jgi:hypothetical protein
LRLPDRTIIAPEKLTHYFLKWQVENDKSKFLEHAGYTLENWQQLEHDIRSQILPVEAKLVRKTRYGDMLKIHGTLVGPNGVSLKIVTIWMMEYKSQQTKLITLFLDKEA